MPQPLEEVALCKAGIQALQEELDRLCDLPGHALEIPLTDVELRVAMKALKLKKSADGVRSKGGAVPWQRVAALFLSQVPRDRRERVRRLALRAIREEKVGAALERMAEFKRTELALKEAVAENCPQVHVRGACRVEVIGATVRYPSLSAKQRRAA